jgi:hypothetical protein
MDLIAKIRRSTVFNIRLKLTQYPFDRVFSITNFLASPIILDCGFSINFLELPLFQEVCVLMKIKSPSEISRLSHLQYSFPVTIDGLALAIIPSIFDGITVSTTAFF